MNLFHDLPQRWQQVSKREQRLLALALAVVALALLWWLGLAPALKLHKSAAQQHLALDAQLQQMQHLQDRALALRAQPLISASDARQALEASLKPLGDGARLVVQQERVSVTLKAVAPEALAQWLSTLRQSARSVPTEMHLTRNTAGGWDGNVLLALPAP